MTLRQSNNLSEIDKSIDEIEGKLFDQSILRN